MVDLIVLVIVLLILWRPFEFISKKLILSAIKHWNRMDSDVAEISNELEKAHKPCSSCKCKTPCELETPSEPEKAKKDKPKKGV